MLKPIFFLAAAAILAPASALAAERADAPSAHISFADLNLANPEGQTVLKGRVRRAAETMCIDNRVSDLVRRAAARGCYKAAIASAEPQLERAFAEAATGQRFAANGQIRILASRR